MGRLLPRVLFVSSLNPGGHFGSFEEYIVTLAHAFERDGSLLLPVFLRSPDSNPNVQQFSMRSVAAHVIELRRFKPGVLRALSALIREHQIEIVHWNFSPPLRNEYMWALRLIHPQVEHIFTDHISRPSDSRGPAPSRTKAFIFSRYKKVVCVSCYVRKTLGVGPSPNVIVRRLFVNIERFKPNPEVGVSIRANNGAAQSYIILFVGQLIFEKGAHIAIEALTRLPDAAVLWLVGTGPEEANLKELTQKFALEKRVRFFGKQVDVSPFMQAADVVVCPSVWEEAAGLSNMEAQACGVPVVASRCGGIPEIVIDGTTGYLFEKGNAANLAEMITAVSSDKEKAYRMSSQARTTALERFSADSCLQQHLEIYGRSGGGEC